VIRAGEIFASDRPTVVQTLLGSCVSACLIDAKARIAGMNHILLPGRADLDHADDAARYGVNAMELLINKMTKLGADRRRFAVKVFGGANLVTGVQASTGPGARNIEFVLEFLRIEDIPVVARDLGGHCPRRVYLRTDTGEVLLKKIAPIRAASVVSQEKDYRRRVQHEIARRKPVRLFEPD
jgi:chemotaxis protein CheD